MLSLIPYFFNFSAAMFSFSRSLPTYLIRSCA